MKIRKLIVIVLAVLMCLSLIAGCGGKTTQDQKSQSNTDIPNQEYKIVISHPTAEKTSIDEGAKKFKELVEQKTNGKIKVEVYPNAQLGADREAIEGVQVGNITMTICSTAPQANFVKSLALFDTPFVFESKDVARKVFDGSFKEVIGKEYEKAGFKLLGFSDQGFRELTLNKPVQTPDDLKGIKIRTMENPYHMAVWKSLGANPTPIAFNEVYTALQQKTVDGQENPYELIFSQKFYEQQKYIINTNHIFQTIGWIMNKQFYDSLPDDLKKIVDESAQEAILYARQYQDNNEKNYVEQMTNAGVTVLDLTPENYKLFQDKAMGVYDMIRKAVGNEVYDAFLEAVKK
jgi:tripartite ATP-independent transporter DctP family solute receptor